MWLLYVSILSSLLEMDVISYEILHCGLIVWPLASPIVDIVYYCLIWIYCLVVEEGREGRDSARVAMYRSHFLLYCKFSTSRNLKGTLAKFFKNPRHSVYRVIFLAYA